MSERYVREEGEWEYEESPTFVVPVMLYVRAWDATEAEGIVEADLNNLCESDSPYVGATWNKAEIHTQGEQA